MRASQYLLPIALTFAFAGCGGEPTAGTPEAGEAKTEGAAATPAEDLGEVIAEVGGQKIYSKEFESLASRKTPADGQALSPAERKEVLDKLIEDKALFQEAKKEGVDNDPKVQKVMVNTLLRNKVYANVRNSDFTQDELRAYFDAHKDEFVVPEKIQIKRIFVKVGDERPDADAKKLAADLRKQVAANPAKFSDIATEKSDDAYRRRGGDLGFVDKVAGKPGIDQVVIDTAFGLKQGDISEPFLAGGGYNIVTVANRRERVERTFEQMRGSVLRKVKNEKYKKLYEEYVANVEKNYTVNVLEDKLNAVKIEPQKHMTLGGPPGMEGLRPGGEDGEMEGPGGEDGPMPGGMPPGMMPGAPGQLPPGAIAPGKVPTPPPAGG
jgi:peptidyl-prolyl cis-trans isomerase C